MALCWLGSPGAKAATMRALDLASLTAAADYIVVGQAVERQSRWGAHGRLIVTDVALRVSRRVKGDVAVGDDLVVTHLGGQIDGLGLSVPGAAAFELGADALVFLQIHPATGELRTVGMSQGVMPVKTLGGTPQVEPGGAGAHLMVEGADGRLQPAPDATPTTAPLAELIARIERLL